MQKIDIEKRIDSDDVASRNTGDVLAVLYSKSEQLEQTEDDL